VLGGSSLSVASTWPLTVECNGSIEASAGGKFNAIQGAPGPEVRLSGAKAYNRRPPGLVKEASPTLNPQIATGAISHAGKEKIETKNTLDRLSREATASTLRSCPGGTYRAGTTPQRSRSSLQSAYTTRIAGLEALVRATRCGKPAKWLCALLHSKYPEQS